MYLSMHIHVRGARREDEILNTPVHIFVRHFSARD